MFKYLKKYVANFTHNGYDFKAAKNMKNFKN